MKSNDKEKEGGVADLSGFESDGADAFFSSLN
jgi:hypothetical protein